jgi:hypothetical protein
VHCVCASLKLKCMNIKQSAIISSPTLLINPKLLLYSSKIFIFPQVPYICVVLSILYVLKKDRANHLEHNISSGNL